MYRIKQIRPDADPLYLGHPVNRLPVWWHDPKYAKPFLTRQEAKPKSAASAKRKAATFNSTSKIEV